VKHCQFLLTCLFFAFIHCLPSIHLWRYSPFRALASLTRRLHSSLSAALLLHPLVRSSCSASLWTTSAHLVLGLPTGLVVWKFPFRIFFGILSSSILIIWPAHSSLLILMSSTMFDSLYKLYSSSYTVLPHENYFWNIYTILTEVLLNPTEVFLTLTEVFPCFFLSCKANARAKLAKTGHGPHSSTLVICVVRL